MAKLTIIFSFVIAVLSATACSSKSNNASAGKVIKSMPAGNNLTVTLLNEEGQLKHGDEGFMLTFTDASGKPIDVGALSLTFHMSAMGTMAAMNDPATLTKTETPGIYRGKANIEMAGEWQAQINYEGPAGKGKVSIPVNAR